MLININSMNINYDMTGEGPDLLFLHGWGSSMDVFAHIIKEFSPHFRCITMDLPGCGGSELPKEPWDIRNYADLVQGFIKELGLINPVLLGHSHGGRVILYLTAQGRVRPPKIVLFDSAGIKPKKSLKQRVRLYSFKTIKWILTLPVIKNYTKDTLEKARKHYGSADYNAAPPVMRQTLVKLINEDLTPILSNIKTSTLLIWGEKDTATPLCDAKIMEKLIPDAGLCVISGAGHYSFLEAPAYVNTILSSFLKGGKQ